MAVKIPQNIDKEDKLVGPLTLKQFLYVLGGGALVFVAWQAYAAGYLFYHEFIIVSFLSGAAALSLAFLTINGRPFTLFLLNLLTFIFSPKSRLWQKNNELANRAVPLARLENQNNPAPTTNEGVPRSDLERLATVLDTGGKMKTDTPLSSTHIINTVPETKPETPEIMEEKLGVEDIFDKTDI